LRECDVVGGRGRVSVRVRGRYPRTVPVLAPYGEVLWGLASKRREYVFRPGATVRDTKNLVGEICAKLTRDRGEVTLSSARSRATFICEHLASHTALGELCVLAGLGDVESLLRYARHVHGAPQSKAALRATLRGEQRATR
jgi:integrase